MIRSEEFQTVGSEKDAMKKFESNIVGIWGVQSCILKSRASRRPALRPRRERPLILG